MSNRPDAKHQTLGGRVGPRISRLVVDGLVDYHSRTAGHKALLAAEGANEFFRGMSREKAQHTRAFWEQYLGADGTPDEVEKLLRFIAHGTGELSELTGMMGSAQSIGTAIGSSIANTLAPINQKLIQADPNSLLDAGTAASAHLAGFMSESWAEAEAAKQGIDGPRFGVMMEMAQQYPGLAELLELWRRGLIANGDVEGVLKKQRVNPAFISTLMNLKRVHLAPADAALMSLRGIITQPEGESIAANSGYTPGDFDLLVKATGEPPGLMQLLEAFRRGFIDKTRLDLGIKQSRVRDEWSDVVEKLRFSPASPSDALRGVIQGHLSEDEGKRIAEDNGLRPEDWGWLVKTEGNPPGVGQMLDLWNRGKVSDSQVTEAIRESRLKDKYIGPVKHLAVKIPEGRQITTMLSRGALTHARAMELLRDHGYEPDVSAALLESAVTAQVGREKQLAAGQVLELYHDHALSVADTTKHLESLGYHPENAALLIMLADVKRARTLQEGALAPIKSAFVGRHITETEASLDIDKLGIAAKQRDYLLSLWGVERFAHRKSLTPAQIVKANEKGLFTDSVALTRLENLGYSAEDAKVILDLEKGRATPA